MSKLSIVGAGAGASISLKEYEMKKEGARTASSIVEAGASISLIEYEMKKEGTRTASSIVEAGASVSLKEYEMKKEGARTASSIVEAGASISLIEYEMKKEGTRTASSIVEAGASVSLIEYEMKKEGARTASSIVQAGASISLIEYEMKMKKEGAHTASSIVGAEASISLIEYEMKKEGARTASAIVSTETSISLTVSDEEDVVEFGMEDILTAMQPKARQSRAAFPLPPPTDPITFIVEEKLFLCLDKDGDLSELVVEGTLSLHILKQEDGFIQFQVEDGGNPDMLFKTQPNINKVLFFNENILCLKEPNMPFPSGQDGEAAEGVVLLNWKLESMDESILPLRVWCSSVSDNSQNETCFCLEYKALRTAADLRNVIISVQLPALPEATQVLLSTGEWSYDDSSFEWSIPLIDYSNPSGLLGFVVPDRADSSSVYLPNSVHFTASNTFSGLRVTNVLPLKGGPPPKFAQRTQLAMEKYQVVE